MSENKQTIASSRRFLNLYEKALIEHKGRVKSVVEQETGGEVSGVYAEEIFEDAEEELRQEVISAGDNLVEQAERLEGEGKITEQERREFSGITAPKGPPEEERIKYLNIQMKELEENIEGETDSDRRQIMQEVRDVAERAIDNAELEMGQIPRSEEGKHRYREMVKENIIRTKIRKIPQMGKGKHGCANRYRYFHRRNNHYGRSGWKEDYYGSIQRTRSCRKSTGKICKVCTTNTSTYPKFIEYYPKLGS